MIVQKTKGKKTSILFVDSDKEILHLANQIIEKEGGRTIPAEDGLRAIQKMQNEKFDLLISETEVEKISSDDFIKRISDRSKDLPIILTSKNIEHYKERYHSYKNISFLKKPYNQEELIQAINNKLKVKPSATPNKLVFEEGQYVIHQGELGSNMYWLIEGRLQISQKVENDQEVVLGEVHPGELVGEMSFLDKKERSASVLALEASEVLEIPAGRFDEIFSDQPKWFQSLVKTLSNRLRITNKKVDLKE